MLALALAHRGAFIAGFSAFVALSVSLFPLLRTLTAEVRVPNPRSELLTGMYTNVTLSLASSRVLYELPATALYFDARGLRVAIVDARDRVRFVPVDIDRDLGPTLLTATGLKGDERAVRLADPALKEGTLVHVED